MISLSTRMRPQTIEDFIGQGHFLYKGSLLYNAILNKTFDNGIFFGPPGTGKTTLARLIARSMDSEFVEINASTTGTKELKDIIKQAEDRLLGFERRATYVYVDEVHRWNKLQQDSLLKALEDGCIKFIGSTTENPYFSINNAILSRVRNIYEFKIHSREDVMKMIDRALSDKEVGLGNLDIIWEDDAKEALIEMSGGDGRIALDSLEYISQNGRNDKRISIKLVEEALQRRVSSFHKSEDKYNLLSALQKSIRGSDPDAAIYYLARLVTGGEDLMTIGRRLLVIASEDVGMAYPQAISIVNSCVEGALKVGLPEAEIILAQAVVLLASSPKSNASYAALLNAKKSIRNHGAFAPPMHLRDAHYKGAEKRGIKGYIYPHDFGGYVEQQYLPDELFIKEERFYEPTNNGSESSFKKYLNSLKGIGKDRDNGDN